MIIDKPGFYNSKAGKCEVVAVRGSWALGVDTDGLPTVWAADDGTTQALCFSRRLDITGPFVEPRKPVEAWAVVADGAGTYGVYLDKGKALTVHHGMIGARLVHLREVEE